MIYLVKSDVLIRGAHFPRTAMRIFSKATGRGFASLRLFFRVRSNACCAKVNTISQAELVRRIEADHTHLVLDVRNPGEYKKGHIPGAINIPHDRLDSRLVEIGAHRNKEIVLYCGSGGRVVIAANILHSAGFSRLLHLDGDMNGWLSNGMLPVVI